MRALIACGVLFCVHLLPPRVAAQTSSSPVSVERGVRALETIISTRPGLLADSVALDACSIYRVLGPRVDAIAREHLKNRIEGEARPGCTTRRVDSNRPGPDGFWRTSPWRPLPRHWCAPALHRRLPAMRRSTFSARMTSEPLVRTGGWRGSVSPTWPSTDACLQGLDSEQVAAMSAILTNALHVGPSDTCRSGEPLRLLQPERCTDSYEQRRPEQRAVGAARSVAPVAGAENGTPAIRASSPPPPAPLSPPPVFRILTGCSVPGRPFYSCSARTGAGPHVHRKVTVEGLRSGLHL